MSLHDRIMSLSVFNHGASATRAEAAHMAKEADELMAEMADAIEVMLETGFDDQCEIVFDKYNAWKESTK